MIKLIPAIVGIIALLTLAGCTVTPPAPAPDAPIDTPIPAAEMQTDDLITDGEPPPFSTGGWTTDFSRRRVAWDEIFSGGPPKDGIPAVDLPQYESIEVAAQWLEERDPVIVFEHNGEVRAYPQAILIWHEIVNDEVGGLPVSITFCPLCNASIAFDRRLTVDGEEFLFDFGTTGRLRNSDLIMYDRQTESWWQQFSGEGIVGRLAGAQLTFLASQVLSFEDFRQNFPDATVLARPTQESGLARSYGRNPYTGYDSSATPFLFQGDLDGRLPALERVVGLGDRGHSQSLPLSRGRGDGGDQRPNWRDAPGDLPQTGHGQRTGPSHHRRQPGRGQRGRLRPPGGRPDPLLCIPGRGPFPRRADRQHLGHPGPGHGRSPGRQPIDPPHRLRSLLVRLGGV